jgi:hypothetical protein
MGISRVWLLALMLFAAPAGAQDTDRPPLAVIASWRELTRIDVDAAHALLADNHPAAVPETGDKAFVSALKTAYARAQARAGDVTSYPGYVATLGEFANAMGDGHIWSNASFVPAYVHWAGIVVNKRNADWVVGKEDRDIVGEDIVGDRIVSCGGVAVDDFARDTLGRYRTVWSVEGMRVLAAPWLLVDTGNPFVMRPDSCVVRSAAGEKTIALHWTKISRVKLVPLVVDVAGKAGFGIRASGAGFWIAIESLSSKAQAVVDAANAQAATLRNAAYVVIDLRGNGGGADTYGRLLADALYGDVHVRAILGPPDTDTLACPSAWRASPGNISATAAEADVFAKAGETFAAKAYREGVSQMKDALHSGRPFTAPLTCARAHDTSAAPPSLMHGKIIVLTDSACFSSCIGVVGYFLKLGAVLAGQTTGADTHYSEVREITLPSGLSTFSTLRAIMTDAPRDIGPYTPSHPYAGDISDTAALETWIAKTVIPALGTK